MAKVLRRWEPVLGGQLDGAATVLASAQRRIPGLIARLTVPSKGARGHLERAILPGAAVYLMSDRFGQDRARKLTATCLDSGEERRARVLRLLDRTPWLFPVLRRSGRRMMQRDFSPPAFEVRWAEDSAQRVRFDMTRCYYLDTLTTLGIPELTGLYCHGDEVMYGRPTTSDSFARARSPRDVTGATSASSGARRADNAPCKEQRPEACVVAAQAIVVGVTAVATAER